MGVVLSVGSGSIVGMVNLLLGLLLGLVAGLALGVLVGGHVARS
ncbi:MAG: hypothetical protein QOF39_1088, partial [Frankiales bacterium]|nr:hypothetical protein [Frankiales bacterium]